MGRRGLIGTAAVTLCAIGATVAWVRRDDWGSALPTPAVLGLVLAAVWLLVAALVVTVRWRPSGRLWVASGVLSVSWSLFVISIMTPPDDGGLFNAAIVLRPSLFFLLLAWPSGYLAHADRIWWTIYSVLQAALMWAIPQLFDAAPDRRLHVVDLDPLASICHAFALAVVLPVGAVVLYVSVRRRTSLLPASGRRLLQPLLAAAAVTMVSELVLSLWVAFNEPGFDGDDPELMGGLLLFVNYLPYAVAPVLMIVAVRRAELAAQGVAMVEIGRVDDVARRFAAGADIPGIEVRFAGPAGTWLDRDGRAVPPPPLAYEVVAIRRDDHVLATVSASRGLSPDLIERTVAAAGASVDFTLIAATARAAQREVTAAQRAIEDAQDAALARLEQDLHDGVQQRLVGLALQASLARRAAQDDDAVAGALRQGVRTALHELVEASLGILPALIGARGLTASIATLAACAAVHVDVDIDLPADLPTEVAAAAWFVAAEAVANAGKHADASRLRIRGVVENCANGLRQLEISVDDNGRGGAVADGAGLQGLRRRVERSGGTLFVTSPIGAGTCIRATFSLVNPIGAVR